VIRKRQLRTSYCWLVWFIDNLPDVEKTTVLQWIPPCRKQLEEKGTTNDIKLKPAAAIRTLLLTPYEEEIYDHLAKA